MSIETGIADGARKKVAEALKTTLADTYALYFKTHAYHWNVEGPRFKSLHEMFEEQYTDMWEALDDLAERIRSLGDFAPGTGRELAGLTKMEDGDNDVPSAEVMIKNLLAGHELLVRNAREASEVAAEAGDKATEDLLVARMQEHEKMAWMLRAMAK